jgi:predicted glycosyltransferase
MAEIPMALSGATERISIVDNLRPNNRRRHDGCHSGCAISYAGAAAVSAVRRRLRVALYSHDTMGLGHLRRNLLIAETLSKSPLEATCLLITGAHEANFFELPRGVDCLTLPRLRKDLTGDYSPGHLAISTDALTQLRARAINSALETFQPDVFIVDKVPLGPFNELRMALESARRTRRIHCVLGLRDILDSPESVSVQWATADGLTAVDRFYEQVWIYGDRSVYDPVVNYAFGESVAKKVRFLGYLDRSARFEQVERSCGQCIDGIPVDQPLVVCTLGGGQDGLPLADAFADSLPLVGATAVLLAGPYLAEPDYSRLIRRVDGIANTYVRRFLPEADRLIQRAERVISMAGYNTVCSILAFGKPALLVPRCAPRQEQTIRAVRLHQLGHVDVLPLDAVSGQAIKDWLARPTASGSLMKQPIDLGGLGRICTAVSEITGTSNEATNGSALCSMGKLR